MPPDPYPWWYISFCDDEKFLGGAFVRAPSVPAVLAKAKRLGIRPDSELEIEALVSGMRADAPCLPHSDRLLTREQIEALDEAAEMTYGGRLRD